MTKEIGKGLYRVAMQRSCENVGAPVENILRAIAVVKIDVEDRDLGRAMIPQPLCRDGGIVDEAVATKEIDAGMMARRPEKRKEKTFPAVQPVGAGDRTAHRGNGRL